MVAAIFALSRIVRSFAYSKTSWSDTLPSPLLSAAPRRPAATWWVKKEPLTAAASCALSSPELDARSAVPSVATFMRSTESSAGPTLRPLAWVQVPP